MKYFYGNLIIQTIYYIFILSIIIRLIINLKEKKVQKGGWLAVIVLIPLMIYCLYSFLFTPYMDIKYAIKGETKTVQGKVDKTYTFGGIEFILAGKEFKRNPWSFKPKEGEKYKLTYLPNSGYVVKYELISN